MITEKEYFPITKVRDRAIDMAKGFLIAMLIFHHIVDVAGQSGVSCDVLLFMKSIQMQLIVCYFMPAFFMITGICSNFDKPFLPFLKSQIKTLLVPAVSFILLFHIYQGDSIRHLCGTVMRLFLFGKDFWFLVALFEAKVIFWIINKFVNDRKFQTILLLLCSIVGVILNDLNLCQNYFMHRHVLDLILFLGFGHLFKENYRSKTIILWSIIIYVLTLIIYMFFDMKIPYVTYTFATSFSAWFSHVLLSFTGSVIVLWICRSLKVDSLIEYMGKKSLAIFLMQWYSLFMFIDMASEILQNGTIAETLVVICSIFISTIAIGLFVGYLCDHTRLRILMGKF